MQHALTTTCPKPIIIGDTEISRDANGRYSLRDLHRAAGDHEKDSPNRWTRTDSYKGLLDVLTPEMALAPSVVARGGSAPGTYVVRELVYAYAMWISPAFHLRVIRAYDTLVQAATMEIPKSFAQALRLAAEQQEQLEAQNKQIAVLQPQADALVSLAGEDGSLCQRDAAKHLGIGPTKFINWLLSMGWTYRQRVEDETKLGRIVAFQDKVDRGYMAHRMVKYIGKDESVRHEALVQVTRKGLARLACYIAAGKGPEK